MKTSMIDREKIIQSGMIPDGLQLIQDVRPLKIVKSERSITEGVTKEGKKIELPVLRLSGVFQKADERNSNGRVYPFGVLEEAVKGIQDSITHRRCLGELDHPPDAKIHLENVSHLITKVWLDKKTCMGELEILTKTPKGAILNALVESKVQIGISSRGIGDMETKTIDEGEVYEVLPGFSLVTWDVVAEPSVTDCQLTVLESLMRKKNARMSQKRLSGKQIMERKIITELHNYLYE